ncbi:hypothetical protein MTO98_31465 [Mucilaginibacter sp. SMC90]|uniref:hypothetical protein n=1 Tax=Mucilaginibacter sp. SMC90 TaxID=2929803 RepID=UPI001FB28F37|nr:hypothetical protein [Mucilaginibacter sp. SMC90]UOE48923.1 hypothetical protein MTO98_31465 [Mucilaginibacter sp. SMC90]
MKALKIRTLIIVFTLFLTSCAVPAAVYLGDTYPVTNNVDVYYDAKDVKHDYKVIGHLAIAYTEDSAVAKKLLSDKAKAQGANGIIIFQVEGNNANATIRADAIKYSN